MEIFLSVWNNWATYEKISISTILIVSLLFILLSVFLITKNKKLTLWVALSLLASAILTVLVLWFLNTIFDFTILNIFIFTPLIVLFINILSLGTSIGYFMDNMKSKSFDISILEKEFLRDSFQLSIFIFLMFSSLSVFLSSTYLVFIIVSGIISLTMIWINYALMYRFVK